MITQIIFTQNELVEMLQGKQVGLTEKNGKRTLFYMENHESVHENVPDPNLYFDFELLKSGLISINEFMKRYPGFINGYHNLWVLPNEQAPKKTWNQIRKEHGFPPIVDASSYFVKDTPLPLMYNHDPKQMRWTYVYLAADGLPEDIRRFILRYVSNTGLKFSFFKQYDSPYEDFVVYCDTDEQMKQLKDRWKEMQKEYYDECNK